MGLDSFIKFPVVYMHQSVHLINYTIMSHDNNNYGSLLTDNSQMAFSFSSLFKDLDSPLETSTIIAGIVLAIIGDFIMLA